MGSVNCSFSQWIKLHFSDSKWSRQFPGSGIGMERFWFSPGSLMYGEDINLTFGTVMSCCSVAWAAGWAGLQERSTFHGQPRSRCPWAPPHPENKSLSFLFTWARVVWVPCQGPSALQSAGLLDSPPSGQEPTRHRLTAQNRSCLLPGAQRNPAPAFLSVPVSQQRSALYLTVSKRGRAPTRPGPASLVGSFFPSLRW